MDAVAAEVGGPALRGDQDGHDFLQLLARLRGEPPRVTRDRAGRDVVFRKVEAFAGLRGVLQRLAWIRVPGLEFPCRVHVVLEEEVVDRVLLLAGATLLVWERPRLNTLHMRRGPGLPLERGQGARGGIVVRDGRVHGGSAGFEHDVLSAGRGGVSSGA